MSKKISQYDPITARNNNDWLLIEEASTGAYKRIKVSDFITGLTGEDTSPPTPTVPSFYCRFSSTSLNLTDGDLISQVTDLSGKNYTATASGNLRPTFKTNVFGNKPGILFSGSQYLDLLNQQLIPSYNDFLVFSVVRPTGGGVLWGGGGDFGGTWGIRQQTDISYAVISSNLITGDHADLQANTNHIICWGRIGGNWRVSKNDGTTTSGGNNTGMIRGESNGYVRRLIIGGMYFDGVPQSFYLGYTAEFSIILNPTIARINEIGAYYSALYSINWTNVT